MKTLLFTHSVSGHNQTHQKRGLIITALHPNKTNHKLKTLLLEHNSNTNDSIIYHCHPEFSFATVEKQVLIGMKFSSA